MSYNFFALLGRMKYIDRWGLMRNTQVENIQEHSHMVSVLSHALAVIGRERFGAQVDPGQAAIAGLYHDASEILTGDLPTPVKYDNPAIKEAYKAVERVAADKLLSLLPRELQGGAGARAARRRKGRRQALRPHQVPGGGKGGQQRVPLGGRADQGRPGKDGSARAKLLYGAFPPRL